MRRAAHAFRPEASRGRVVPEAEGPWRSPFQRDRDRVVHSTAFRRLDGKTQVYVAPEGDHFRTRLTHSLEVAQIARTVCRALELNEDLAEAVALAHDLGHSPFGHAGESALDAALAAFGGFDHNLQTFRIVTSLERRYADFDGLNLTFETLEGILKHNGPLRRVPGPVAAHPVAEIVDLAAPAPLEAQVAALADDVAYCNHDLDDGLRAEALALEELSFLPLAGEALRAVDAAHPGLEATRRRHETIRRLIDGMVRDLIGEARRRLVAPVGEATIAFSPGMAEGVQALRAFLHERVYRHYKVNRMTLKARRCVSQLFEALMAAPDCLPDGWRERAGPPGAPRTAEAVRDYIAGMTDRYALDEHGRLFGLGPEH